MDAQTESLFTEAMKLSPVEREDLAVRLFGSLENDQPPLDPAWDEEIARRVDDMVSGRVQGVPTEEAFARLRAIKDA